MALHLTIENETALPDGGPLSVAVSGDRGLDIGRDPGLGWTLPDPTRTISGRHCEVRVEAGDYWLRDVSRNGTFLNRSGQRMGEPQRLRDGDRIEIGRYIIAVRIEGGGSANSAPVSPADYWNAASEAAPPISPRDLRPERELKPVRADFSEWAVDVPNGKGSGLPPLASALPAAANGDMSWASASPPPPPPAPPPVPTPRRPAPATWDEPASEQAEWSVPAARSEPAAGRADVWGAPPTSSPPQPPRQTDPIVPTHPAPHAELLAGGEPRSTRNRRASFEAELRSAPQDEDRRGLQPTPSTSSTQSADPAELIRRFAAGAGLPAEVLAWRDPGELAEEIGALLRLSAESLKQLLAARAETKRVARTGSQTTIGALDNNPLKFSPTIGDALRIMFGRPTSGYLDARRAMEGGFRDLKTHQVKTYSAMQHAVRLLMEDLDPDTIEHSGEADRGLGGLLGSKKARLWDMYVTRWDTLASPHEEGMVDAFLMFFAECYDRGDKSR